MRRDGVGVAHHGEGAPQHHPEQPDEYQDGEWIIVEVAE